METLFDQAYVPSFTVLGRMALAAFLGAVVGYEREYHNKPLGLRSYMLVGLGSAAFATVTMELAVVYDGMKNVAAIDPSRVIQGVIGGIGFLGAGALIQNSDGLKGTSTAASIWSVGAIGLACGFGFYWHAIAAALIAVLILVGVTLARRLFPDG